MKRARRFDPALFINEGLDEQLAEKEEVYQELLEEELDYWADMAYWDDPWDDWDIGVDWDEEALLEEQARLLGITWDE